jgi:hypothetical protein
VPKKYIVINNLFINFIDFVIFSSFLRLNKWQSKNETIERVENIKIETEDYIYVKPVDQNSDVMRFRIKKTVLLGIELLNFISLLSTITEIIL